MRARERDTSRLHHLGTLAVRSAVRVSLCERDEHKGDSNGRRLGDSAPHDHAHNPMRPGTADKRPSESHTRASTAFSSRVPSLIPASRAQIVDDTYFFRARSAWRTYSHDMLDQIEVLDRTHARAEPPPHLDVPHMGPITPDLAPRLRAVARVPGDYHHRPHRKSPQRTVPCRYKQPALGSFELSKPAKSGARRSSRAAARSVVANNNDRRNTAWPGLSRRACAFVCESRILKDRGSRSCLRRAP